MITTTNRVARHTSGKVNERIRLKTDARIAAFSSAPPKAIDNRLKELDAEWDIERTLETNGSVLLLAGLFLGVAVSKKFLILPAAVGSFCLQHALQGWCPPLEAFRRMGIRTSREIEEERTALKAMRGDFGELKKGSSTQAETAMEAARR